MVEIFVLAVVDFDACLFRCEDGLDDVGLLNLVGEGASAEALPVIKIIPPDANYDFHHKYFSDETQYLCPTGLPEEVNAAVQSLALAAYKALGCRTWGRADVMIDQKTGKPYLLEMNTSPGMTSHSLVPMAAKAAGVEYADLVVWILSQTLKQAGGLRT